MSWFSFTDIAKTALSEAQKKIDKALDIQHDNNVRPQPASNKLLNDGLMNNTSNPTEQILISSRPADHVKRADLSSKKKARPAKHGSSILGAKRLSSKKENNDFFTILNDGKEDESKISQTTYHPAESFSDISLKSSSSQEDVKQNKEPLNDDKSDKPLSIGTETLSDSFSEVALSFPAGIESVETLTEASDNQSTVSKLESLESSYSEALLTVSSENISPEDIAESEIHNQADLETENLSTHVDNMKQEENDEAHQSEQPNILLENTAVKKTVEDDLEKNSHDKILKSVPPQVQEEVLACRTVSPSLSTAASSEIDILDHESSTSEVSFTSKYPDGQIFFQSPVHITNIDSDASQALSPLPDDNRSSGASSPVPTNNDHNCTDIDQGNIPPHSFQPVEKVASQVPTTQVVDGNDENQSMIEHVEPEGTDKHTATLEDTTAEKNDRLNQQPEENKDKYMVMCEKMEVYEQQLLTLSCKNAQLSEENDNLRTEISRTKEECDKEAAKQVEELLGEIKVSQNNNEVLKEEKNNLVRQMAVLKSQLAARMTNEQVQKAIAEKEDSIKGLMEEGEKLSKKHLQQNNLIKKLKTQLQERESELKTFKEKVTNFQEENSNLKDELLLARGQGKEEREASMRISDAYEQRERQTQMLKEKLSQAEEKQRTLQVNLDAAYVEIGDLHKQKAEQESKSSTEWKEREEELRRQSELELKKILSEQEHQRQLLMLQMLELNNNMSRTEAMAARKDDDHRREIRDLQQRLQESEDRNQDLSDNVSSATRPLLRQIENLQATHSSQQRSWNALEKTLNTRLGEAQAELLAAQESERIAQSGAIEAKSRAVAYEKQIENDQKNLAKQAIDIEELNKRISEIEDERASVRAELLELQETHKNLITKSRKERLALENQLQMEKVRAEADRKKYAVQQENLQRERDRMMWSRSEMTSVSSNQIVETESVGSSNEFHSTDTFEKQLSSSSLPGLASHSSIEMPRSMSNILENLQTQLKLRDGEIAQLRGEINMLERTRSSMAEEIVRLTNLTEDMEGVSKELEVMKEKLGEVEGRYTAILTMYGEKQEENEELRMDLADVKAMYRQQIDALLKSDAS